MSAHLTLVAVLWTTASAALVCQLRCWQGSSDDAPGGRFNRNLTTTTTVASEGESR